MRPYVCFIRYLIAVTLQRYLVVAVLPEIMLSCLNRYNDSRPGVHDHTKFYGSETPSARR